MMKISVFHSLEQIKNIWQEFQKGADCYGFQTYEWVSHWYQTIGLSLKIRLCIVLIWDENNTPILLFPFGIQEKMRISCLVFLDGGISDYNAPLVSSIFSSQHYKMEFSQLWERITDSLPEYDVIHLQKLPEFIKDQTNPLVNLRVTSYRDNVYFTTLLDSWEDFYQNRVKKKIRLDSRRQKKRLNKLGDVRFVIARDTSEIQAITAKMIEQKIRRYRETSVQNMFNETAYKQFYSNAACRLVDSGLINVSALMVNDKIVATHWGMIHGERFYYLMPTYASGEWRRYSVGRLLLEHLIEWCIENKLKIFDFTVGSDPYKLDWCDKSMTLYEYIQINTFKGYVYYFNYQIKKYIRQNPTLNRRLGKIRSPV